MERGGGGGGGGVALHYSAHIHTRYVIHRHLLGYISRLMEQLQRCSHCVCWTSMYMNLANVRVLAGRCLKCVPW